MKAKNMSLITKRSTANRIPVPTEKVPSLHTKSNGSGRFYWTVETFYRASDLGVFNEPKQWELIDGDLWRRNDLNPRHAFTVRKIGWMMQRFFEPMLSVQEEKPIHLSTSSEPMPDVCVVVERGFEYASRHPTKEDVRLLVEVADTTESKDTGEKAELYAQAGIADYWVVLVNKRQVNVYRNPEGNRYPAPRELNEGDTVSPLAAPDRVIAVSDLLPPVAGNIADTEPVL